ncbi:MAG TPA: MFS transporter [Candidatus Polarisedimenticolaceae bacterium]|nr:MFS transporter [Candidatus Polarisedimenticolaceae bacterium]
MARRTPFPPVFWVANTIEVLERFAYYGIYIPFGIYMVQLGFQRSDLGRVQTVFLLLSYCLPIVSGTFADRYGFKPVLITSYLIYLPSILLLTQTKTLSGIALVMILIGLAAGTFKPLISGTVRVASDATNKTLGFGIFYLMVNIGGTFGPIVAAKLRVISWNLAFGTAASCIALMLLVTIFFYKEPPRQLEGKTLKQTFSDLGTVLVDVKFVVFLLLLGIFFWIPFWSFFNLGALYIEESLDRVRLYQQIAGVPLIGSGLAWIFGSVGEDGIGRISGDALANTGLVILFFQLLVSRFFEKWRAMPAFLTGLLVSGFGFVVIGLARVGNPGLVMAGIFFFAVGEMASSPRIQEYITWLAPKEKAGLYMGSNFLATAIGAFSGTLYQSIAARCDAAGHPEYTWYILAAHVVVGALVLFGYVRMVGEFREVEA